ncbi:MAG: hypothetical protein QOG41_2191, partial [Thermoleophilaceae bacterium]|nr:hypothetical protein [Thermoleophilaceae bacterium]
MLRRALMLVALTAAVAAPTAHAAITFAPTRYDLGAGSGPE